MFSGQFGIICEVASLVRESVFRTINKTKSWLGIAVGSSSQYSVMSSRVEAELKNEAAGNMLPVFARCPTAKGGLQPSRDVAARICTGQVKGR